MDAMTLIIGSSRVSWAG